MSSAKDALAAAKASAKEQAIAVADEPKRTFELDVLAKVETLDWKKLPPPLMAQLLSQKPFNAGDNQPPYYLSAPQALWFALWCFREDISPLGNEVIFNRETWTCSLTTEGQKSKLRNLGIIASPPSYEFIEREWPKSRNQKAPAELNEIVQVPKPGGKPGEMTLKEQPPEKDRGCVCRLKVLMDKTWMPAEYTAWISEWYMPRNKHWRERPDHMLQIRSYDKCMENITGCGISAPIPDNRDETTVVRAVEREAPSTWVEKPFPPFDGIGEKTLPHSEHIPHSSK